MPTSARVKWNAENPAREMAIVVVAEDHLAVVFASKDDVDKQGRRRDREALDTDRFLPLKAERLPPVRKE